MSKDCQVTSLKFSSGSFRAQSLLEWQWNTMQLITHLTSKNGVTPKRKCSSTLVILVCTSAIFLRQLWFLFFFGSPKWRLLSTAADKSLVGPEWFWTDSHSWLIHWYAMLSHVRVGRQFMKNPKCWLMFDISARLTLLSYWQLLGLSSSSICIISQNGMSAAFLAHLFGQQ